jgi:hypothetical protein
MDYFMHTAWAGLFGGYSVFWLVHYLDVALLSHCSFEPEGPANKLAKQTSSKKRSGRKETPSERQGKHKKAL